jgi:hypothetical protein
MVDIFIISLDVFLGILDKDNQRHNRNIWDWVGIYFI